MADHTQGEEMKELVAIFHANRKQQKSFELLYESIDPHRQSFPTVSFICKGKHGMTPVKTSKFRLVCC